MNALRSTISVPRVAVIGAGVIGCATALELRKRGAEVTVFDRGAPGSGCSAGNSGSISPGSIVPLAMPGVLATVPSMLFDSESAFSLRWSYLPEALPWLLRFIASARPAAVARSAAALAALHQGAVEAHRQMARELNVPELFLDRGHLYVYPDQAALSKDASGWRLRKEHGVPFERIDRSEIEAMEPALPAKYQVGIVLPGHATILNPRRYVEAMARAVVNAGGRIERGMVTRIQSQGNQWDVVGDFSATGSRFTHVVVAAGAWSKALLARLGLRFSLESQRGYHVQFPGAKGLVSRTVMLADRKVLITPMEEGLRVGGTVEIAGLAPPPHARRAAVLERIAHQCFPSLAGKAAQSWMGHRPCMPDSVPVIGPVDAYPGLWAAFGHGHLGITESLPTARRIADGLLAVNERSLVSV